MTLKIKVKSGNVLLASSMKMHPYGPIFLAEVLAGSLGERLSDICWIGSPTWIVSGMLTDHILNKHSSKKDKKRMDEINKLIEISQDHACWIEGQNMISPTFGDISEVKAIGPTFDFDIAMPRVKRWKGWLFGGYEGTFTGIHPDREDAMRKELKGYGQEYVLCPADDSISFKWMGKEFEIPKDLITEISIND